MKTIRFGKFVAPLLVGGALLGVALPGMAHDVRHHPSGPPAHAKAHGHKAKAPHPHHYRHVAPPPRHPVVHHHHYVRHTPPPRYWRHPSVVVHVPPIVFSLR